MIPTELFGDGAQVTLSGIYMGMLHSCSDSPAPKQNGFSSPTNYLGLRLIFTLVSGIYFETKRHDVPGNEKKHDERARLLVGLLSPFKVLVSGLILKRNLEK